MIRLTEGQYKKLHHAINLIIKRKRIMNGMLNLPMGTSAIVTAQKIIAKGKDKAQNNLSQYDYIKIVNAIAMPWAILYFGYNESTDKDCVEKLATFIEDNTISVISI